MPNELQRHMRTELVRFLVSRAITCIRTGEVLDVRTCVVLTDADGDPAVILSPSGWREISGEPETMAKLTSAGYAVDPTTVRS